MLLTGITFSQINTGYELKSDDKAGLNLDPLKLKGSENKQYSNSVKLYQKPTKKIYFVPGGKIGMFFLQGDYTGHQLIAIEAFGKYVGDGFWAEISIPFRFKTSPAFTDIGVDVNVMYPFLGSKNKSEVDPFVGGGLGLHFIGRDRDDPEKTSVAARGGLGLNLIAGAVFFRNYDFNIVVELKYFNYLREFDDLRYQGIGLNIGATFPR
ncbi:MAG: hypothetical protein UZ05_CHB002001024 [Chlorobi bacterium OLB5]|nr:MAG: hypothetical protein UZ05_CHB002001024 [Chlorobi bacterium OLB5]